MLVGDEYAVVASAVEGRRREFAAGRACARAALIGLGYEPGPLLPGRDRAPRWPAGVVGSITHCAGFAGVAVAPETSCWAIGIDAELAEPLPTDVVDLVLIPAELEALAHLPVDGTPWDRIAFSAKESVYKAWFPMRGTWLGFEDAQVAPSADGTFSARVLRDNVGPFPRVVNGRWAMRDGVIGTGVALPVSAYGGSRDWAVRGRPSSC